MRIGITGIQGVGKTTLLNALRSEPFFKDYKICNEITREVKKLGLPINQDGTEDTQRWIMSKHAYNILANENMLTDRTPLDCYLYTSWLYLKGKVTWKLFYEIGTVTDNLLAYFDKVYYIRPEFKLEEDEDRTADQTFADEMHKQFENIIPVFETNKFVILTGSVSNRVKMVLEDLEGNNNEKH